MGGQPWGSAGTLPVRGSLPPGDFFYPGLKSAYIILEAGSVT